MTSRRSQAFHMATLFASFSTLICCALPALLVALGAGAVLAGVVSAVPQLVWLSEHKVALFAVAGGMLVLATVWRYQTRHAPCPVEAHKAEACRKLRRRSGVLHVASLLIYGIGFFFAFVAPYLEV